MFNNDWSETESAVSTETAGAATFDAAEAAVTTGAAGWLSPQPDARSAAAKANGTIRTRIRRLPADLPTSQYQNFRTSTRTVGERSRKPRIAIRFGPLPVLPFRYAGFRRHLVLRPAHKKRWIRGAAGLWADDYDSALKSSGWVAVEFNDGTLSLS